MLYNDRLLIARSGERELCLSPRMANRHGLITGATGTGKTVTVKVLAESFSAMGVPVFMADVKSDLTGMCCPGSEKMTDRAAKLGVADFPLTSFPVRFWDIFGKAGTPVRCTVSDLGPSMLGRLLNLTEVQTGVLNIAFRVADDHGLLLLDMKDLRAMLTYLSNNRAEFTATYGNVSAASVGAIQRALLAYEEEGSVDFFGEPALDMNDWLQTDSDGRGYINILAADGLITSPRVYSTFLLWLMTELFERLPEVGDPEKPKMVFFFDEAHLLFSDCPKALTAKITQVVKLIRSKGVGIYFISQSPSDIPGDVLAQLSNRVQHALHAYTPDDMKGVKVAAGSFRPNPAFKTEDVISELGVGEALVSFLDEKGVPEIVERAKILPPQSLMGPAPQDVIRRIIEADGFELKYRESVDRESAYEILQAAQAEVDRQQQEALEAAAAEKQRLKDEAAAEKLRLREEAAAEKQRLKDEAAAQKAAERAAQERQKVVQRAASAAMGSVTRGVSSNLVNSFTGGRKTSSKTIATRAATNALNSVLRSGTTSIMRGLFGNRRY